MTGAAGDADRFAADTGPHKLRTDHRRERDNRRTDHHRDRADGADNDGGGIAERQDGAAPSSADGREPRGRPGQASADFTWATAVASTSTHMRGSISPATSTIVNTGRTSPSASL
jgi:hypothetical protein